MILIYPPVAKPGEPPAGIARLSGSLSTHGIDHAVVDLNIESLLHFIHTKLPVSPLNDDKWTTRSLRNIKENYLSLKDIDTYRNIDRYKRAVIDLNHAVEIRSGNEAVPGITNYRNNSLNPLRSGDLLRSVETHESNPYYSYFSSRLSSLISGRSPRFAGLSINYLSQALSAFAVIGFLKDRFPELKIIAGGGLVTSWMRNPGWNDPFKGLVDRFVAGPGEKSLLEILGTENIRTEYARPDYSSFPLDNYLSPGTVLPYSASSGCYWGRCSFCPERAEDNQYIHIHADRALDEVHGLVDQTRPRLVHLLDNAINLSLLQKLANSPVSMPWYGFVRVNKLLADYDFCIGLKRSGCVMLKLGLESGDQGVLDKMQKGISISDASRVLKMLKKTGIAAYVYLLFGTPAETEREAEKTLKFVVNHGEDIDFLNVALFNMPIYGQDVLVYNTKRFYEADLSLYTDFEHPAGWNRKKVRSFLENRFKRNSAVSKIINNDPPFFTSNHAPFFVMKR